MNEKEKQILRDMAYYILFMLEYDKPPWNNVVEIFCTLTHDIHGLMEKKRCFRPRTSGYEKVYQEKHEDSSHVGG